MRNVELLHNVEELNNILGSNECSLFGAGRVAKTIVLYAARNGYSLKHIYVSSCRENPAEVMGVPVVSLQNIMCPENMVIVGCVKEQLHENICRELESVPLKKIYLISDDLYNSVTYKNTSYELDEIAEIQYNNEKMLYQLLRFVPRPCLEYLILNILDHCNLKCKGCDHFACIADQHIVPYQTIYDDLEQMSKIFKGDYISEIAVMGGEPLLHPDLKRILKAVRKFFPYITIRLTTNGLLLLKQDDEFWLVCRENDVVIVNTRYPINLDYQAMHEKAVHENVKFNYFEGTNDEAVRTIFKKKINLKGDSNPVESFAKCHISNYGNFLMEGKLYGCPFSCQSYRIFNKKYDQNLRMTDKDFLNIYKVRDMHEILEFAAKPKYYCRYCVGRSLRTKWERSKQDISEWIDN